MSGVRVMAGLYLLCVLLVFASSPEHYGQSIAVPFILNSLHFNESISVALATEVYLRCEYFLYRTPDVDFELMISFVSEANLTQDQLAESSSGAYLFSKDLKTAHKSTGLVLNVRPFLYL